MLKVLLLMLEMRHQQVLLERPFGEQDLVLYGISFFKKKLWQINEIIIQLPSEILTGSPEVNNCF